MNNQIVESNPIWSFILVIALLAIVLAWFAWKYWRLTKIQQPIIEKGQMNHAQIQNLKKKLKDNEKAFNKLNPIVERYVALREGMDDVVAKLTTKEKLEALHALLEKAEIWDKKHTEKEGREQLGYIFNDAEHAMLVINLLQQKIKQFYGLLRIVDLDEDTECQIRTDFLVLSMMMIDIVESISNPNYRENDQGVNVKLLKEEITLDEAVAMTAPVTFLDIETSQWAQKLFKSLEKWAGTKKHPLIEQRPYLLNGLRMEFKLQ